MDQRVSLIVVTVDGQHLAAELGSRLVLAEAESSLKLPDTFLLSFRDPFRDFVERSGVRLGSEVSVKVSTGEATELLVSGEVTALEAEYDAEGSRTVLRGLDKVHRLFRGRRTKAWVQQSASDIVTAVVGDAGLSLGKVDSTEGTYALASQASQSDWEFLQQLAHESDRLLYGHDGQVHFVRFPLASEGPEAGTLKSPPVGTKLVLGLNLLRLRAAVGAGDQVSSVSVRSWDVESKQAIVGSATTSRTALADLKTTPHDVAAIFGSPTYVATDVPYATSGEAGAAAERLADALGARFVELEGEAIGNPALRAGTAVSLAGAGAPFDGKYLVTAARHVFDPSGGYTTWFQVSGLREASLAALDGSGARRYRQLVPGVVPAVVSDTKDPSSSGRVKLTFPWLDDSYVSDWARVAQASAGEGWGFAVLPEVGAEVLVAFEHGDVRRPYVIGGLYNGKDKPSLADGFVDEGSGQVNARRLMSRQKHAIVFNDAEGTSNLTLVTGDGNYSIVLDQTNKKVVVKATNGDVEVSANNVTVTCEQSLSLKANQNVTIEAQSQLSLKGAQVQLQGEAEVQVSSNGTGSVQATGPLTVKGAMVAINA